MLPAAEVILEAARRKDWHAVLGLTPGDRLTPKSERAFRAQVHPDKGHPHDVAAAVGQALDALRAPAASRVDRLIEECSEAVRSEPLNSAGGAALRRRIDALVFALSSPRLRYYCEGWGKQASDRCYTEVLRIWPAYKERMRSEPDAGREFLAKAAEIDSFRDSLTEERDRIGYAHYWVKCAAEDARRAAARRRKTEAQKARRAANSKTLSEAEALAKVLEHCDLAAPQLATPLGQLRAGLRSRGVGRDVLLAAGISSQTRRQHRPQEGESFYYATVASGGKRVPLRLRGSSSC
jgi:hypothetical protein